MTVAESLYLDNLFARAACGVLDGVAAIRPVALTYYPGIEEEAVTVFGKRPVIGIQYSRRRHTFGNHRAVAEIDIVQHAVVVIVFHYREYICRTAATHLPATNLRWRTGMIMPERSNHDLVAADRSACPKKIELVRVTTGKLCLSDPRTFITEKQVRGAAIHSEIAIGDSRNNRSVTIEREPMSGKLTKIEEIG